MINVTFTGIDEDTDLRDLPRSPHIEYAVLFSTTRCFETACHYRYPHPGDILRILQNLILHNTALHVCGDEAKQMLLSSFGQRRLKPITDLVQRIQVNGEVDEFDLNRLCKSYPGHRIITQFHVGVTDGVSPTALNNHEVLVDGSGGRGISPEVWTRPDTEKRVGFAGGLNPENINQEVAKIMEVADKDTWIDIESGVRHREMFSVPKMRSILDMLDPSE